MHSSLVELFDFLRFPSISTASEHKQDCRDCALWLEKKLLSGGFQAELIETKQHPVVYAQSPLDPQKPTLLIYGHYDVQPVDPENLWDEKPFQPQVKEGRIFARGATDNKGQIFAHILGAIQLLEEQGELPVNLKFLIEGEEEIGSLNLPELLEQYKEKFACDIIAVSDSGMLGADVPTMGYGLRGIACLELKVTGPSSDLHSGVYGGAVCNPAAVVAQLVAKLHDDNRRVAIPGFYDEVSFPEAWEKQAWEKLADPDKEIRQNTGAEPAGETGFSTLERLWSRPTAEVNGIYGGYQGEGSKTVLPASAGAKISFRLVPDQNPQRILDLAEEFFRENCPEEVTIEVEQGHTGPAYLSNPHSTWGKAAQAALLACFPEAEEVSLIREGGSIPIVALMKDILGADVLLLGLALPDANIHAPNENFPVENFELGQRLNQALMQELAKAHTLPS